MKKANKFISMLIIITLCVSTYSVTYATSSSKILDEQSNLVLQMDEYGQYKIATQKGYETVSAKATEDEEIFHLYDNKYVTWAYDDIYQLVDKIDVDINDFKLNNSIFSQYGISQTLIDNMEKAIVEQKEIGNDNFAISIYAPSMINAKQGNVTTEYSYYYYNGKHFRDISVKYWHMRTDMIENKGSNAKDIANAFINFIISAIGVGSTSVSAFGAGLSALDVYQAAYGTVSYGSHADYTNTLVVYDKIEKQTDMEFAGSWHDPGCISYKVWLDRNDTYQFYSSSGNSHLSKTPINFTYYSESFQSAAARVLYNFPTTYYDDAIRFRIYSTTVVL